MLVDLPGGTSLYKALKIPATGLFPQDDVLNRFAVSTNWYSSLDVASASADSDWGRSQGYEVVEFAAPKALRLIDLGDDGTLGYVWASLEADLAWTESQLATLQDADPPTTNPETVAIVTEKLADLRRDMEIVQLTTGYGASYARQLELLVTCGDAITNDFTYDPGTEIDKRGISPTDTFIVETASPSVWRPATLVTGSRSADLVTWGGAVDDLNRISFTTDIDKELTSILGTYLNVDGYFATELPSLFHRDGRLIEEVGLFIPRDSTTIVSRPALLDINVNLPDGMTASDSVSRTGAVRVVKQGRGTLILGQANSHSGGTVVDAGELVIRNPAALGTGTLEVAAGAKVTLDIGSGQISVSRLELASTGVLDLATGAMLLAAGNYDLAAIRGLITTARGTGAWSGPGITSSSIQPGSFRAIGHQLLPDGSLRVGYSAVGDATMDGTVSIQDLIAVNAGGKYGTAATDAGWWQGDFNDDGRVNVVHGGSRRGMKLHREQLVPPGDVTLAPITEPEFPVLRELAGSIWRQHYATIISAAQIEFMLAGRFSDEALRGHVQAAERWLELLRVAGTPVGYCGFELASVDGDGSISVAMKLSQLYVLESHRGMGLGRFILGHVEGQARELERRAIWLQVNKQNTGAISLYRAAGFEVVRETVMDKGHDYEDVRQAVAECGYVPQILARGEERTKKRRSPRYLARRWVCERTHS